MNEEQIRRITKVVVDALRPERLTVAEVREVLKYIDESIEHNVVLE